MKNVKLFEPFFLRGVQIKNRIMVSPMWQYRGEQGRPTDWHLMNLGRLAAGGAGLVFQEGTSVERRGCGTTGDLGIWDDDFVPALRRLAKIMRDNDAVPGIQLMHAGRKARQKMPFEGKGPLEPDREIADWEKWIPIAPSALAMDERYPLPEEISVAGIVKVQQAFVDAAHRADEAGFDVLNIHGAHGYLLHEFMSEHSNRRGDSYGGSFANRIRFPLEVFEAVRAVWPEHKPIMMRLSVIDHGWNLEDTVALVRELKTLGIDMIDCSSGGLTGSPLPPGARLSEGYQVPLAAHVRRETGVPTAAVGLIVHAAHAERILEEGAADLVALGREMMMNPNWPIDAGQKLSNDAGFSAANMPTRFWLAKRAAALPDLTPSTFTHI